MVIKKIWKDYKKDKKAYMKGKKAYMEELKKATLKAEREAYKKEAIKQARIRGRNKAKPIQWKKKLKGAGKAFEYPPEPKKKSKKKEKGIEDWFDIGL